MIPGDILSELRTRLNGEVHPVRTLSGGSINQAVLVETEPHGSCFLKWNRNPAPDMFEREEEGLALLRSAVSGIGIPEPLVRGERYLLMEYIPQNSPGPGAAAAFGRSLARMHRTTRDRFGLDHDNYIGSLPQSNREHDSWAGFFRDERLEPQLRMALDSGRLSADIGERFQHLYRELENLFPEEPPALLHGDLWSGNYFYNGQGEPVIIDPAVYYGHREMELAFTRLFGGFPSEFYRGYEEEYPLQEDFPERTDICNLYPLMVHTNLFGGSYGRQVERIINRF